MTLTSPYNFVPINRQVYYPWWGDCISMDIPFRDGEDGFIEVTLRNVSPLFTRNGSRLEKDRRDIPRESSHIVEENGDKRYFIPGTTIKGMLRATLEIMAFGKMSEKQHYSNRWFGYRDIGGRGTYRNIVSNRRAGWLSKDDDDKYRADVFDHELEDPSSAENMSVLLYLRHRCGDGHAACDKQADAQSSYGHHDRIGQEIKEIQELHADDRHIGERSVAQAGQGSQKDHLGTDQQRAGRTVPFEFIREGGHCALRESDRARERCEKDQCEESDADGQTEAHAGKNLGHGDKHQGRTCTERLRISPGKSEDSRDDHKTGQHGDAGIKDFDLDRGFLDRDFLFHIGTEGDQDTHCYR